MSEVNVPAAPSVPPVGDVAPAAVESNDSIQAGGEAITKAEAREAIRKHKLKIDGQEIEVDEDELKRGYGHQRTASKLMQEGKKAKQQAEEFLSMMKDPAKAYEVLRKLGHDPRQLSEKYLAEQIQDEMMDPRDKELRDTKAKLKAIEDMERSQKEQIEERRNKELRDKYKENYEKTFVEALETVGLPKTKGTVAEIAKYISRSAQIGYEMSPSEAAQLVREDIQKAQMSLYQNTDGEMLMKLLGDDVANKLRKFDTSRVKDPNAQLSTPVNQATERKERPKEARSTMTRKEWREFNRK